VATFHKTVHSVESVVELYPQILPAYYVQDYEPWFYMNTNNSTRIANESSSEYEVARMSYEACNKSMAIFAKSDWIARIVSENHNVTVHKVISSLDHKSYYPDNSMLHKKLEKSFTSGSVFRIVANIELELKYRNPLETIEVLLRIASDFPKSVQISLFGSVKQKVASVVKDLIGKLQLNKKIFERNFKNYGIVKLDGSQLASYYRNSDIFIDMSVWQGGGRSVIEAMASGCVAIVPSIGVGSELCEFGSCVHANSSSVAIFYEHTRNILMNDTMRWDMIKKGIARTSKFSLLRFHLEHPNI
jgi:glycosyltransferase involved in cell wall biosynthesis